MTLWCSAPGESSFRGGQRVATDTDCHRSYVLRRHLNNLRRPLLVTRCIYRKATAVDGCLIWVIQTQGWRCESRRASGLLARGKMEQVARVSSPRRSDGALSIANCREKPNQLGSNSPDLVGRLAASAVQVQTFDDKPGALVDAAKHQKAFAFRGAHAVPYSASSPPYEMQLPLRILLTPKRKASDDDTIARYPYYAGFSSRFAEDVLRQMSLRRGALVADPWVGSGTTLVAASRVGCASIGVDLNPFAGLLAASRLVSGEDESQFRSTIDRMLKRGRDARARYSNQNDPLGAWLPPAGVDAVRRMSRAILGAHGLRSVSEFVDHPVAALAMILLIRSAASFAKLEKCSNPTWSQPSRVRRVYQSSVRAALLDAAEDVAGTFSTEPVLSSVRIGDARSLPIESGIVDVILTSPPYCTRIDYAVTTAFELAAMGLHDVKEFSTLRRTLMGTTMLRCPTEQEFSLSEFPRDVAALLRNVASHKSHGSRLYYFRNLHQYFSDAAQALGEIRRVLRNRGSAILVVQTSYYKELEIDLPKLFISMGNRVGLVGRIVAEIPVGRTMATRNLHSRRYSAQRIYRECVVEMKRG